MRLSCASSALGATALLAFLAGCSAGTPLTVQNSVQPQGLVSEGSASRAKVTSRATTQPTVFVSDDGDSVVYILVGGILQTTIKGFNFPLGITLDSAGNLYVANNLASTVVVYEPNFKTILTTLQDTGQYPSDVSYSASTSLTGVVSSASSGGQGSVQFYAKGATTPTCSISNAASFSKLFNGAFDAKGNFYVDGLTSTGTTIVGEITGGCKATTITPLTTTNTIRYPAGVKVAPSGKILIEDAVGYAIYTYAPPVGTSLGTPVSTTPITGAGNPVAFALMKAGKDVWVADARNLTVGKFAYPKGGKAVTSIGGFPHPVGITVSPIAAP